MTIGAVESEPRARLARKHSRPARHLEAIIAENNLELIIGFCIVSLHPDLRADRLWRSEQDEGLIDKMRADIVEQPAARTRLFAPCAGPG